MHVGLYLKVKHSGEHEIRRRCSKSLLEIRRSSSGVRSGKQDKATSDNSEMGSGSSAESQISIILTASCFKISRGSAVEH